MNQQIMVKKNRAKALNNRHPWVFSGAIQRGQPPPAPGSVVDVVDYKGRFLARGIYNPRSQIQVRLLTWEAEQPLDAAFWRVRLQRAISGRQALIANPQTTAYRLVHSEGDGLPGLVVDQYAEWLVVQFLSLAVESHREIVCTALNELLKPRGIYERSDTDGRKKEGLPLKTGLIMGDEPPPWINICENGLNFPVDVREGHKTGFYLDQRENRHKAQAYMEKGDAVLNLFAYTGAFAAYAAQMEAGHVTNVDSSAGALQVAEETIKQNDFARSKQSFVVANAFEQLRYYQQEGQQFDLVILDPPKFVHSKRQLNKGLRGYKDINMLGMQLLKPGGMLLTFSCSGLVSADLFQKVLFGAAVDVARSVQIVEWLAQGGDHPVSLTCPESAYLKGFACRVW